MAKSKTSGKSKNISTHSNVDESEYSELEVMSVEHGQYIPVSKRKSTKKEIPLSEADKIEKFGAIGLKVEQMAILLDMSKRTFERRMKESPELSDALARGRAKATEDIASVAYSMAKYNYKMTQYWLNCQAGWFQKKALEVTGAGGSKLIPDNLTEDEIKRRLEEINKRLKS